MWKEMRLLVRIYVRWAVANILAVWLGLVKESMKDYWEVCLGDRNMEVSMKVHLKYEIACITC